MSFDKLEDHLWRYILDFLTPSFPTPLSGLTKQEAINEPPSLIAQLPDADAPGVTRRVEVQAPALCALMRTSVAFNRLASVALYRAPICDDLSTLLNFLGGPPAHPGIESKTQLLRHTRYLHLEYKQKGNGFRPTVHQPGIIDPPYSVIMANVLSWYNIGRTETEAALAHAAGETTWLSLGALCYPPRPYYGTPFPSLTRLTVGAIFGGQDGLWEYASNSYFAMTRTDGKGSAKQSNMGSAIAICRQAMVAVFSRSPLTHFCQRGHSGPLSLPPAFNWVDDSSTQIPPTQPLFTAHFATDSTSARMPGAINGDTQWLLERPIPKDDVPLLLEIMNEAFFFTREERDRLWSNPEVRRDKRRRPNFAITLYGSSTGLAPCSASTNHDEERSLIAKMNKLLQAEKDQSPSFRAGEKDKNSWRSVEDCPSCEACGWRWTGPVVGEV